MACPHECTVSRLRRRLQTKQRHDSERESEQGRLTQVEGVTHHQRSSFSHFFALTPSSLASCLLLNEEGLSLLRVPTAELSRFDTYWKAVAHFWHVKEIFGHTPRKKSSLLFFGLNLFKSSKKWINTRENKHEKVFPKRKFEAVPVLPKSRRGDFEH